MWKTKEEFDKVDEDGEGFTMIKRMHIFKNI